MKLKITFVFSTVICSAMIIASNGVQENIRSMLKVQHQITKHSESNRLFNGLGLPDNERSLTRLDLVLKENNSER